ncbi:MAG TPA: hypothetical protein VM677_08390 [Actinokineospora sp.]|nr:hypothetical protein [Actinokineospora sp.]
MLSLSRIVGSCLAVVGVPLLAAAPASAADDPGLIGPISAVVDGVGPASMLGGWCASAGSVNLQQVANLATGHADVHDVASSGNVIDDGGC